MPNRARGVWPGTRYDLFRDRLHKIANLAKWKNGSDDRDNYRME